LRICSYGFLTKACPVNGAHLEEITHEITLMTIVISKI